MIYRRVPAITVLNRNIKTE